jgi:ATP-dependent exoDNAse (exonuclease V) beta subunit
MTPTPQSPDTAARERIRYSLHESLLVEASAGTGKTSELVRRILNVLRQGLTTIDRIVAVTFTNKAAGELKLRLRQELDRARSTAAAGDPTELANLEHALAHLEEAAIGTIHAFCAQILRERPVEARIDPDFEELDDSGARSVYASVFRRWLQRKLNEDSPGLRRALARLAADRDTEYTPIERLQSAGWAILEWRDFPLPWQRPELRREEILDQLADHVESLRPTLSKHKPDTVEPIIDAMPWVERQPRDYDMLEAFLFRIWKRWRYTKKIPDPKLQQCLTDFRPHADADLAAQLREELWELVDLYDDAKRRAGQLDFVDLLLLTRNLIRDNTDVRTYLQQKFSHLFVDEFQDTDPLQAEILLLLSADKPAANNWMSLRPLPGKLFLVGDPKQSIYKFRRADVNLYQILRGKLEGQGLGVVTLSRSFRSVRSIQHCINAAFAPEMTGDALAAQASYVPLEEHRPDIEGQPAIIALPAPEPYGKYRVSNESIDACLPNTIIGMVDWLINHSGWKVADFENGGELRAIRPRDICLLFRRFTNYGHDLTRDYVRSLEDRGIAHLLVGSKTFHWREEIETMRAALTAVEWPEDELAVFAALKGALFAVPDHILLRFRHEHGALHPFREYPETLHQDFQLIREALDILAALHVDRNHRPLAETVYRLLESTRAWAAFAFRPAGNQALANVRRVVDLARQFESNGGLSFRGFVEELTAQADKAESMEAPTLEEGADGVRLMTVHAAKGLEFPIVILADMTANLSHDNPDKSVEAASGLCAMRLMGCAPLELIEHEDAERRREQAEGVRVAYVAATRARDLLILPTVGDEERVKSWLSPLNKAIYPDPQFHRKPKPAPNCPDFGRVTVFNRPSDYIDETSVAPGLHQARTGGDHNVIWWDPSILPDGQEGHFAIRQKEIFAEDTTITAQGLAAYHQWRANREALTTKGAVPTLQLTLASETETAPPTPVVIRVERTPRAANRPSGRRFGALVHETLRRVPLNASRQQVEATAALAARLLGSEEHEQEAAIYAVRAALAHPLLHRARQATRVHREYPLTLTTAPGQVVEGVIDLAFTEADRWILIDFKSDHDIDSLIPRYQTQIAWYAEALNQLTALPVEPYLLAV